MPQVNTVAPKVPQFFAGEPDAPTVEGLREQFSCDHETACELMELAETGFRHGGQGWYPDGDFSSDADWCYGPGERIQKLEMRLEVDDDSVFDVYFQAHAAGLQWYEKVVN